MGRQEAEHTKRMRHARLQDVILTTVGIVGALPIAVVAPNVIGAMVKMGLIPHPRQMEYIKNARTRLVKRGLLKYENGKVRLTAAGERALREQQLQESLRVGRRKWDGKWRVLSFDIPERRRALRDRVRSELAAIGFVKLQDSVWVYPYDCEDLMTLLKAELRIGRDMQYLIVDSIEYDTPLRKHFSLPL